MDITAYHLLALTALVVLVAVLFVVLFEPGMPYVIRGELPVCDSHESRGSGSMPGCHRDRLMAEISLGARACWRGLCAGVAPGRAAQIGRAMKDAAGGPNWLAELARAVDICQPNIESGSDNFPYGVYGHSSDIPCKQAGRAGGLFVALAVVRDVHRRHMHAQHESGTASRSLRAELAQNFFHRRSPWFTEDAT